MIIIYYIFVMLKDFINDWFFFTYLAFFYMEFDEMFNLVVIFVIIYIYIILHFKIDCLSLKIIITYYADYTDYIKPDSALPNSYSSHVILKIIIKSKHTWNQYHQWERKIVFMRNYWLLTVRITYKIWRECIFSTRAIFLAILILFDTIIL